MKRFGRVLTAVLVASIMVWGLGRPVQAQKPFLKKIRRSYELDKKTGKCFLCHHPKPHEDPERENLNIFGKMIQAQKAFKPLKDKDDDYKFSKKQLELFLKVVQSVENKDADGDGATNKEELDLGTFPGRKDSVPDPKKLAAYRKKNK